MTDSRTVKVTGTSMMPFIPPGSILTVERFSDEKIEIGDVVCYIDATGGGTAHRVVGVERRNGEDPTRIWVRGDAQQRVEEIPADAIAYIASSVCWRKMSYRTQSIVGRMLSRAARTPLLNNMQTRLLWTTLWQSASAVRNWLKFG